MYVFLLHLLPKGLAKYTESQDPLIHPFLPLSTPPFTGSPLMNWKVRALIKLLAEMNLSDVLMHF